MDTLAVMTNHAQARVDKLISVFLADSRLTLVSAFFVLVIGTYLARGVSRRLHTAPGPPRLPFLGNVLQIPAELQFLQYAKWAQKYGPIFSLDVLGRHAVVLNTYKAAGDIFDRQSKIYNDRPRLIMASEILGGDSVLPLLCSRDPWRRMRRAAHEGFNIRAVEKYQSIQHDTVVIAMLRTLTNPITWETNLATITASAIASTVYGWPPLEAESPLVPQLGRFFIDIGSATLPGVHMVDCIPIMKHIPSFLAGWKRKGRAWHNKVNSFFERHRDDVKRKVDDLKGEPQENWVSELFACQDRLGLSDKELTWLPAAMLIAGTDATTAILVYCVLAMLHYPDTLCKAQAELDREVGRARAPTFEDSKNLPYIRAIVRETLRWRPPVTLVLPHAATEDGWYDGYFIPKGSMVVGNVWDPSVYPDFDTFRPERFLDESGQVKTAPPDTHNMGHTSYGFGTRICPGRHFANQELFIAIAMMLWSFDIRPLVDEKDEAILPPTNEWVDDAIVVRPASFQCNFTPRFSDVQEILENTSKMGAA
ncbi:cytochrome P450 [Irpex lacteus]|nr:cytochrome P450 [Irpex lacteus]